MYKTWHVKENQYLIIEIIEIIKNRIDLKIFLSTKTETTNSQYLNEVSILRSLCHNECIRKEIRENLLELFSYYK